MIHLLFLQHKAGHMSNMFLNWLNRFNNPPIENEYKKECKVKKIEKNRWKVLFVTEKQIWKIGSSWLGCFARCLATAELMMSHPASEATRGTLSVENMDRNWDVCCQPALQSLLLYCCLSACSLSARTAWNLHWRVSETKILYVSETWLTETSTCSQYCPRQGCKLSLFAKWSPEMRISGSILRNVRETVSKMPFDRPSTIVVHRKSSEFKPRFTNAEFEPVCC